MVGSVNVNDSSHFWHDSSECKWFLKSSKTDRIYGIGFRKTTLKKITESVIFYAHLCSINVQGENIEEKALNRGLCLQS